jgi:hypothetical protein
VRLRDIAIADFYGCAVLQHFLITALQSRDTAKAQMFNGATPWRFTSSVVQRRSVAHLHCRNAVRFQHYNIVSLRHCAITIS